MHPIFYQRKDGKGFTLALARFARKHTLVAFESKYMRKTRSWTQPNVEHYSAISSNGNLLAQASPSDCSFLPFYHFKLGSAGRQASGSEEKNEKEVKKKKDENCVLKAILPEGLTQYSRDWG